MTMATAGAKITRRSGHHFRKNAVIPSQTETVVRESQFQAITIGSTSRCQAAEKKAAMPCQADMMTDVMPCQIDAFLLVKSFHRPTM